MTICKISDLERQFQKFAIKDPGQQFEKFEKMDLETQLPKFAKKSRTTIWKNCKKKWYGMTKFATKKGPGRQLVKKGIWNSNSEIANSGHCTVKWWW